MTELKLITERLDQLGQELRNRPSIVDSVMTDIDSPADMSIRNRTGLFRRLSAFVAAACVLIAVCVLFSRTTSLYAQTIAALTKVESIHVEGWTSRIVRKWPLEQPREQTNDRTPLRGWYWYDGGVPASHEQVGPVVRFCRGSHLQEYQQDVDLLFVDEGNEKDNIKRFSGLERFLELLKQEGAKSEDLGQRLEAGQSLHGIRLLRGNTPTVYWFDTKTHLPFSLSQVRHTDDGKQTGFELKFSYDKPVPGSIVAFAAPKASNLRYGYGNKGQQIAWNQHVQDVGLLLDERSIDRRIAVLPREKQQTFSYQYTKLTPDGKYWVLPLDNNQNAPLTVSDFIDLRVQDGGTDRAAETWRIDGDLLELTLPRVDMVFEKNTPWNEWVQFALSQIGLEYTDVIESRTYWIAKHDGRRLRPWREVSPPVPYVVEGGEMKLGLVRPGIGFKLAQVTMHDLVIDFNRIQNIGYRADHPILVDQTDIPRAPKWEKEKFASWDEFKAAVNYDQYYVATDSPWFSGVESRQMARDWFHREFGVTITEEQRPMTIHTIRRKQ